MVGMPPLSASARRVASHSCTVRAHCAPACAGGTRNAFRAREGGDAEPEPPCQRPAHGQRVDPMLAKTGGEACHDQQRSQTVSNSGTLIVNFQTPLAPTQKR